MNVLITGANGFIGRNLVPLLIRENLQVAVWVRSGERIKQNSWAEDVEVIERDLEEPFNVPQFPGKQDVVIHLAGLPDVEGREYEKYMLVNYEGTKKIIKAAYDNGVRNFIFISSIKTKEGDVSPYSLSKMKAESFIKGFCEKKDMKYCILRPGIVFGPGMKGNMVSWMQRIQRGAAPALPKSDGRISMIGVTDLCYAVSLCLRNEKVWGKTYTLSDGNDYWVNRLDDEFRKCMNKQKGIGLPRFVYFQVALCGSLLQKIFGMSIGFDISKYNTLFKNEPIVDGSFKEDTGFVPQGNFLNEIPALVNEIN